MGVLDNLLKIRPKDFELSQVQDNLARPIEQIQKLLRDGGVRRTIPMGTFWVGANPMPTTDVPLQRTVTNAAGTSFQTMTAYEVMPVAGIVSSIQGGANGAIFKTWTLTLYLNGKAVLSRSSVSSRLYTKQGDVAVKFAEGDTLGMCIRGDASINQSFYASIDVESQG